MGPDLHRVGLPDLPQPFQGGVGGGPEQQLAGGNARHPALGARDLRFAQDSDREQDQRSRRDVGANGAVPGWERDRRGPPRRSASAV